MVNAKKIDIYCCPICDEMHENQKDADWCCEKEIPEKEEYWECDCCKERFPFKEDAEACCKDMK